MSIRVLACGDIHLKGAPNAFGRWVDYDEPAALQKVIDIAIDRDVQLVLVSGDVFDKASTPEQRLVWRHFVETLLEKKIHVHAIRGNHDQPAELRLLDGFSQNGYELKVDELPGEHDYIIGAETLQLLTVPHHDVASLALKALDLHDVGQSGTAAMDALLQAYHQKVASHDGPSLVLGHGTATGAELDNGHIPKQDGVVLNLPHLEAIGHYCPVFLGHYHLKQEVGGEGSNVWYSGSLTRNGFGESREDKGVLVTEWDGQRWSVPEFISVNPRSMHLLEASFNGEWFVGADGNQLPDELSTLVEGSRVRFRYKVDLAHATKAKEGHGMLERLMASAYKLVIEPDVQVGSVARDPLILAMSSDVEMFRRWALAKGESEEAVEAAIALLRSFDEDINPFAPRNSQLAALATISANREAPEALAV